MNLRIAKFVWPIVLLLAALAVGGCTFRSAQARAGLESTDLMTAAHAILLEDDDDIARSGAWLSLSLPDSGRNASEAAEQILVRLINATKDQRNQLDAACRSGVEQLTAAGKQCERQLLEASCEAERARLTARLSLLRKIRGDRRRALTRFWHSVKRTGAEIWHRLGPTGRTFFRSLEKDVIQTVVAGGSLHGGVLRTLVIQRARAMANDRLDDLKGRILERILLGRASAQASNGADCSQRAPEVASPLPTQGSISINPLDFLGDDCEGGQWLDETWPEVRAQLQEDGKACQPTAINSYHACLEDQANQGACPQDALNACSSAFEEIPLDIRSVGGASGQPDYTWPITQMTFSFSASGANGSMHIEREGSLDECTYSIDVSMQGTFDYGTCSFQGTGTYSSTAAVGPNGWECILTSERGDILGEPIQWEAELANNEVHGTIQRPSHPFSFQVPLGGP
jgi:hypothetical protein